jgi:hypothetical protein
MQPAGLACRWQLGTWETRGPARVRVIWRQAKAGMRHASPHRATSQPLPRHDNGGQGRVAHDCAHATSRHATPGAEDLARARQPAATAVDKPHPRNSVGLPSCRVGSFASRAASARSQAVGRRPQWWALLLLCPSINQSIDERNTMPPIIASSYVRSTARIGTSWE